MTLQKNDLFHGRYWLVAPLGDGASAQVWKAKDTKANQLTVAVKIFSASAGMDTYGMQNFAREFTSVHDINHTNLLKPLSYDICEGTPYLVLQYCENGSAKSMIGRADEADVVKLLHDVAAALEYLHEHDIVHQDIKPDNILLDDNCNFLVTDFGISVASTGDSDLSSGSYGTQAYMAPERFSGTPVVKASDIWSLGATAFELATGDAPFGDQGGLVQSAGGEMPPLPAGYQPEVKEMIQSCLALQPWDRPFARDIRQKIEIYWETGSWKRRDAKKILWIAAASLAVLLVAGGLFYWDYTRTKISYYKDYAEYWGVPEGIGPLTGREVARRAQSYRFEYARRKLRRMSLVNAADKVIDHSDTEFLNSRFADVRYFYADKGNIDYKKIYDPYGKLLYKMDYDENLKKVVFKQDDEFSTEMTLNLNTTSLHRDQSIFGSARSRISSYKLTFDERGLLVKREYAGFQNAEVVDEDLVNGQRYQYDAKGRVTEEQFLGIDGEIRSNRIGLAIKTYTYDEDDNWTRVAYLSPERKPAHDGENCPVVELSYDAYGNRVKEIYTTADGRLCLRAGYGVAGFEYTYDEHGNRIEMKCLGTDGRAAYSAYGWVTSGFAYDENGFCTGRTYHDENGAAVPSVENGESVGSVRYKNSPAGLQLEEAYFDISGEPMENTSGVFQTTYAYDSIGNILSIAYYDRNRQPAKYNGFYSEIKLAYDEFNRVTEICYLSDGKPALDESGVALHRRAYNRQGNLVNYEGYDTSLTDLTKNSDGYAGYEFTYDENGNLKTLRYFDEKRKPCLSKEGYASWENLFDERTNFLIGDKFYDVSGKLLFSNHYKYDPKGNKTESYTTQANGRLKANTAVEKTEYDEENNVSRIYYCTLEGALTNSPGETYAQMKYRYDGQGNCCEIAYYGTGNSPAKDQMGIHRYVQEYDFMRRVVKIVRYGTDNQVSPASFGAAETRFEYDVRGNETCRAFYDGHGHRADLKAGWSFVRYAYTNRNGLLSVAYYGKNEQPVISKEEKCHKVVYHYDEKGKKVEESYWGVQDNPIPCASGYHKLVSSYDAYGNLTEERVYGADSKPVSCQAGYHKVVYTYKENRERNTVKTYSVGGALISTLRWDGQQWVSTAAGKQPEPSLSDWMGEIRKLAAECPKEVAEGMYLWNVSYTSSSIEMQLKLTQVSKYEIGEEKLAEIKKELPALKQVFANNFPTHVRLTVILADKADRVLITL